MSGDLTPPRRGLGALPATVAALALSCFMWVGPGAGAQTPQTPQTPQGQPCSVGGLDCLTAQQQQQIARIGDELTGRRARAQVAVAAAIDAYVDYWVAYATQLGYAIAYSYLPG